MMLLDQQTGQCRVTSGFLDGIAQVPQLQEHRSGHVSGCESIALQRLLNLRLLAGLDNGNGHRRRQNGNHRQG